MSNRTPAPALVHRVSRWLHRWLPQQPSRTTSDKLSRPLNDSSQQIKRLQVENSRQAELTDSRDMVKSDPRAGAALKMLARDVVGAGFTLAVDGHPEAETLARALIDRLSLQSKLDDVIRLTRRDGDGFYEYSIDSSFHIVALTRKPTLEIHRNSNRFDRFDDPAQAYWWSDTPWLAKPSKNAIWFAEWQICHLRANHDENRRYGSPDFASSRKAWKRLDDGEDRIAFARRFWSQRILAHILPGATETDVAIYRQENAAAMRDPWSAATDWILGGKGGEIKNITGNTNLGDIKDILHHLKTWNAASPVPLEFISSYGDGGNSLANDGLKWKLEQYRDTLNALRTWITDGFIKPALELQWLLKGIYPPNLSYAIEWSPKQRLDSSALEQVSRAIGLLQGTNLVSEEQLVKLLTLAIPVIDRLEALEHLADLRANQPDEIERLSRNSEPQPDEAD